MSNIFQNVASRKRHYNNFNLTRECLTSGQFGKLIPVQCEPVVPGDLFKQDVSFLMRLAPMSAPAMVRLNVHFHSFYVPYRLLTTRTSRQSGWEKFIENVGAQSDDIPELPTFKGTTYSLEDDSVKTQYVGTQSFMVGSLADYLGLPVCSNEAKNICYDDADGNGLSLLPFLAYQLIYNDWYRRDQITPALPLPINCGAIDIGRLSESDCEFDEDELKAWTDKTNLEIGAGDALRELFQLRTRNYERDYFTSALPEPQFGDDVMLSNDVLADVSAYLTGQPSFAIRQRPMFGALSDVDARIDSALNPLQANTIDDYLGYTAADAATFRNAWEIDPYTDTAGNPVSGNINKLGVSGLYSSFSVNELRLAFQLQGVREKINRGGTRYIEILKTIWGIESSDARLQRVQYLGGVTVPITIGEVVQLSESQQTPQGTMTGKGVGAGSSRLFKTKHVFEEHGYVMTIMSVTPRTNYYGGVRRMWRYKDPIDFYVPDFDHLGEQEINSSELKFDPEAQITDRANYETTFGYTPRYSELKSSIGSVHGEFRTTLDNWHLARSFEKTPVLSTEFIQADVADMTRIFDFENIENTSNEQFYCEIIFGLKAKRPMSKYSTPYTLF